MKTNAFQLSEYEKYDVEAVGIFNIYVVILRHKTNPRMAHDIRRLVLSGDALI